MENTDSDTTTPGAADGDVRTATVGESAAKSTMGEFSHTNPYTGEAFGDGMVFDRGPAVAADGGRADATSEDEQTMEDVDHEHPDDDAADANQVFERGRSRDESDDAADESDETTVAETGDSETV